MPSGEFRPPADDQGEFEVQDLLDHCTRRRGSASGLEYLVKWKGYSVFGQLGSLPRISPTVLRCYLLIGSAEDCAEPKGGVVLALCMTSLITLLCMRCAAHLRVACIVNFMYTEFWYCWV